MYNSLSFPSMTVFRNLCLGGFHRPHPAQHCCEELTKAGLLYYFHTTMVCSSTPSPLAHPLSFFFFSFLHVQNLTCIKSSAATNYPELTLQLTSEPTFLIPSLIPTTVPTPSSPIKPVRPLQWIHPYGFTIAYRYSKLPEFLAMAQKVSNCFIAHLPEGIYSIFLSTWFIIYILSSFLP